MAALLFAASAHFGCSETTRLATPDASGDTGTVDAVAEVRIDRAAPPPPDNMGDGCAPGASFDCTREDSPGVCEDFAMPASCFGDHWQCFEQFVPVSNCACAKTQPPGCVCTSTGVHCTDGGTDADAADGGDGGCTADAEIFCVPGANGICDDVATPALCKDGQWHCPDLSIPTSECRCSTLHPPGCFCTPTGLVCRDGGTDG